MYTVKERKGTVNTGFSLPSVNRAVFSVLFASDKPDADEGYVGFKVKMPANKKIDGKVLDTIKFVQPVSSLVMAKGEPLFSKKAGELSVDENPPLLITTSSKGIRFEKK